MSRETEVLNFIDESQFKGNITIEEILDKIPKSPKKAQEFIKQLITQAKENVYTERELDAKIKSLRNKLNNTEPMKALAKLKGDKKKFKKNNEQLILVIFGARKMAKAAGIDLSEIKSMLEG